VFVLKEVEKIALSSKYIKQLKEVKKYNERYDRCADTACSDPEHALSHYAEMRASTLKNDHMKKTKNIYMKC
jgi:hypothetical protein